MRAGDALHHPAIANRQPLAVNVLETANVGAAVFCNGNTQISIQLTGHAGCPEHFVPEVLLDKPVNIPQGFEHPTSAVKHRRDQLQQGFGIIGGDPRMGQRGTQGFRMRCLGDEPVAVHPQPFFFHALEKPIPVAGCELAKYGMAGFSHGRLLLRPAPPRERGRPVKRLKAC